MTSEGTDIRSILLIRFSSMGDLVLMSSLVDHFREQFPKARVTLVTRHDLGSIYQFHPGIQTIVTVRREDGWRGLLQCLRLLRGQRWDLLYDAHGSLRSIFLRLLVPARVKLVVNKRTLQRLILICLKWNLLPFHYFKDQLTYPLKTILPSTPLPKPTRIYRSKDIVRNVSERWPFSPTDKVIGIVPSAQWEKKRWPLDHFRELVLHLEKDFCCAIFGGPEDTFCESLVEDLPKSRVVNFQGQLSLLESFEALSRCQLVVANDTGLMHAAEAVQTDVLAILGPTGEQFGFVPFRPQSDFVTKDLWCRPCSKNGQGFCIRLGKRPCLRELNVEDVLHHVYRYFNKKISHVSPL